MTFPSANVLIFSSPPNLILGFSLTIPIGCIEESAQLCNPAQHRAGRDGIRISFRLK